MILEHASGEIDLGGEISAVNQALSQAAATTPAGELVVIGDAGWDPATLTLRARLRSGTSATPGDAAWAASEALRVAAKTAVALRVPGPLESARTTYLHGLRRFRRRPRGTWWELELVFQPRALVGRQGTGETLTLSGAALTLAGRPLTLEVH